MTSADRRCAVRRWTDCHCHLGDDADARCRRRGRAQAGRRRGFVTVGTDARAAPGAAIDIAAGHDDVWATVGLHPHDAVAGRRRRSAGCSTEPEVVAVGECGLDYHYDHSPRDVQRRGLRRPDRAGQRAAACPSSSTPARRGTTRSPSSRPRACPSARSSTASPAARPRLARGLDLGAYLSFCGIVTFKSAAEIREAAALVPARSPARRDRQPVPRARAAPRPAQPSRPW